MGEWGDAFSGRWRWALKRKLSGAITTVEISSADMRSLSQVDFHHHRTARAPRCIDCTIRRVRLLLSGSGPLLASAFGHRFRMSTLQTSESLPRKAECRICLRSPCLMCTAYMTTTDQSGATCRFRNCQLEATVGSNNTRDCRSSSGQSMFRKCTQFGSLRPWQFRVCSPQRTPYGDHEN